MNKHMKVLALLGLFLALATGAAHSGRTESADARPLALPPGYGSSSYGLRPEHSFENIQFVRLPKAEELTNAEKVMIAGVAPTGGPAAGYPYWKAVFANLNSVYVATGTVPSQLTPAAVAKALGIKEADVPFKQEMINPLTGEYPKLDCTSFSPGGFSVHVLTEAQKQHFATVLPEYRSRWYIGQLHMGGNPNELYAVEKNPPVFFVQMYGEKDRVIEQGLRFRSYFKSQGN
jgi:hypothetical protein